MTEPYSPTDEWWMDQVRYPGPPVSGVGLTWDDPDSDPLGDLQEMLKRYDAVAKSMGKVFIEVGRKVSYHMRGTRTALEIQDEINRDRSLENHVHIRVARPKVIIPNRPPPNVGPRSGPTFGPGGKRRY